MKLITLSTLLHLRLPFSFFLLPIYLMGLLAVPSFDPFRAWIVFIVLHVFIYPASNGFNTFYDRDKQSIGTLRRPPPVTPDLLPTVLALDIAGIALALLAGWSFALGCFIYGLASKAYSWPPVRIKRRPVAGWLFTAAGQGTLTVVLVAVSVAPGGWGGVPWRDVLTVAGLAGLFLLGVYPLTQVYQHEEDAGRGDRTMSMLLGVRGTFVLAAATLGTAIAGLGWHFGATPGNGGMALFLSFMAPAAVYFALWLAAAMRDEGVADYDRAMRLCLVASSCLSAWAAVALWA